jgi:hypothetical protein
MAKSNSNSNLLLGCGIILLLSLLLFATTFVLTFGRARQETYYPGSVALSNHANYRGLPTQLRWDNSYLTTDPFNDVYRWYSIKFDLGAEDRALGNCITLEGPIEHLLLEQTINVEICGTSNGQMVFVSRSMALRRIFLR